jgi:hemolysin type calcium-binding protein
MKLSGTRRWTVGGALVLAIGALPATASAAATVGQVFAPTNATNTNESAVQDTVSSGNSYVVPPPGGVLTSWSHQADLAAPNMQLALRVFTKQADPNFTPIAESELKPIVAGQLNSFPTRIPVSGGELIGFRSFTAANTIFPSVGATGNAGDRYALKSAALSPLGSSVAYTPFTQSRLDISAVLEADADGDGFGDETQDGCSTNAQTSGPCPVTPSATCDGKQATIIGTDSPETLSGTNGKDIIAALGGNDGVKAKGGNDIVCGGGGNDDLKGQGGKDQLFGEKGKDELNGGGGKGDLCNGGKGSDEAKGSCEKERSI